MTKLILCAFFSAMAFGAFAQTDVLPDVQVTDIDGKAMNIRDFVKPGKVYVLDFWATWCHPCKQELDNIKDLYADWQKKYGVEMLAVSTDDARTVGKVASTVAAKGWKYTIVLDKNSDLRHALNFEPVPYTFVVNKEGKITFTHNGYKEGDENELEDEIAKAAGVKN